MIKISIIIPVYKVEAYIERCLKSVMSQTFSDEVECILVDDCSTDHSIEIIQRMLEKYTGHVDFKLLHHEKNKGLSEARNTGIVASQGKYVYFLDSDDAITPDCIKKLWILAEKYQADFVLGDVTVFEEDGEKTSSCLGRVDTECIKGNSNISRAYANQVWYPMAWNKLVSKRFLLCHQLLFHPGIYHEDELWSFTLASLADKLVICREVTYLYFKRGGSIMGSFSKKHIDDSLFIIKQMSDIICIRPDKYLPAKIRTVSMFFIFKLLLSEYDDKFRKQTIRQLRISIDHSVKYAFPMNLKDAVRALVLILPTKLSLVYVRLLKNLIF